MAPLNPPVPVSRKFGPFVLQHLSEPLAGVGVEIGRNLFWWPFGDDVAAAFSAFGTEVDDPVSAT